MLEGLHTAPRPTVENHFSLGPLLSILVSKSILIILGIVKYVREIFFVDRFSLFDDANDVFFCFQGGLVGKLNKQHKSSKAVPPDPSLCLSHQSRIKAMYPANNYLCHSPATSSESCLSVSSTSSPEELSNLLPASSFTQGPFCMDSQTNSQQQNSGDYLSFIMKHFLLIIYHIIICNCIFMWKDMAQRLERRTLNHSTVGLVSRPRRVLCS